MASDQMIELRIHRRGGQGAVVASKVLAEAAFLRGRYVQSYPDYGVERRGAPVVAVACIAEPGDEIFNFHQTGRATNGRLEGADNRLGVLKRPAYGFVNAGNFASRALLLTPSMPT